MWGIPSGPEARIIAAMDLIGFHRMRTAIQDNAAPGTAQDLATVEDSLRSLLMGSAMFQDVEVECTDDPDHLVIALCAYRDDLTDAEVASGLERMWVDRVSYPFWEAHALHVESGHVELEGASRPSPVGGYVTLHLVAQQVRIPAQRTPSEAVVPEPAGS